MAACIERALAASTRGMDKGVVRTLGTCGWVRGKQNGIIIGATSTVKAASADGLASGW